MNQVRMQGQLLKGMKMATFPLSDTGRRIEGVVDHVQRLLGQMEALLLVSVDLSSGQPVCCSILQSVWRALATRSYITS